MAVLSPADRDALCVLAESDWSGLSEEVGIGSQPLAIAMGEADQWYEDNQAAYKNTFSPPAKTNLTDMQKVKLFVYVLNKRYELLAAASTTTRRR